MGEIYDFYEGIDKTLELYNFTIKYWYNAKPGVKTKMLYKLSFSLISLIRLEINSAAVVIARTNEIINDLESNTEKEEYNKKIDSYIEKLESFSKIKSLVELTPDEKRQKIKNCLAHSNFKIVIDGEGYNYNDCQILIENEFIKGKITLKELDDLKRFYTTLSDELDKSRSVYSGIADFLYLNKNNSECLEHAIKKIQVSKIKNEEFSLPRNVTAFQYGKLSQFESMTLSDEGQELIKNYIKYIGLGNWICLPYNLRSEVFSRHIKFMLSKKIDFRQNEFYVTGPVNSMFGNKDTCLFNQLEYFKYEAPSAYVSCILDLGYFCFNYLREANKKEEGKRVEFHNFNLEGINYSYLYDEPIRYVDESIHLNKLLDGLKNRKNKVLKSISKYESTKQGVKISKTITEEKRQLVIKDSNDRLKEKYTELKEVELKINELQKELETAEKYYDSSNFFRHLRNSFAHGFYEVDYKKALSTQRLEDIVFKFSDYDIDACDKTKRQCVFETEITAKRLIKILNDFGNLLSNTLDKDDIPPTVLISTSGAYKDIELRANNEKEEYEKQNIKVIKIK